MRLLVTCVLVKRNSTITPFGSMVTDVANHRWTTKTRRNDLVLATRLRSAATTPLRSYWFNSVYVAINIRSVSIRILERAGYGRIAFRSLHRQTYLGSAMPTLRRAIILQIGSTTLFPVHSAYNIELKDCTFLLTHLCTSFRRLREALRVYLPCSQEGI